MDDDISSLIDEDTRYIIDHAESSLMLHALDNGRGWATTVSNGVRVYMVTRCWPEFDLIFC